MVLSLVAIGELNCRQDRRHPSPPRYHDLISYEIASRSSISIFTLDSSCEEKRKKRKRKVGGEAGSKGRDAY